MTNPPPPAESKDPPSDDTRWALQDNNTILAGDSFEEQMDRLLDIAVFHEGEGPNGSNGDFWVQPDGYQQDAIPLKQAILAATRQLIDDCRPEDLNWHKAIGDIVGHDDKELDNFDRGYNKAIADYHANLIARLEGKDE